MFLSRLINARREERGSALIGVIALLGVTGIIAVTVGTVSVSALQSTNGVAASVEARGAAEAGINAAELALRGGGGCPASGVVSKTTAPAYSVRIQHDTGSGWVDGCPPNNATQVRFLSTGEAERPTPGSSAFESERVVEAVYQYIPEYVEVPDIDPAVYAYSIDGVLKKFVLDSADFTISADVQIKTGDFECSNNASVAGDVILANGAADLTACTIAGTLHVTKGAGIDGASLVTGDVIAGGDGITGTNPTVRIEAGTRVNGNVFAGGNVSVLSGSGSQVLGNVTATRDTSTKVIVANGSTIGGNVLSSGTIQRNGTISGTQSTAVTGLQAPIAPRVPNWVDMPWAVTNATQFQATTWYQQGFTNRVTWTGSCTMGSLDPRWVALSLYTTPTVIDATGCIGGVTTNNNLSPNIGLSTNIVFIADKFTFNKLYFASSVPSVNRKLYFVVPDNTADELPTCTGEAGNIYLTNEADIQSTVSAFLYSPCEIISDRNGLRGQLYGGVIDFDQQAQMTYVPTSPPGVDFSASLPPVFQLVGAYLGDRLSIREVASGG
ncbi:hypothetical protein [Yonghaparkia sp. Soil809]|uniref:hypothetical protein n=1 Tax=Yonghaparkia sp. Soil809 TaxID=1736417 RepID=UPI0006F40C46|nr:hypothetical protein [Yonghaparkia sp. Soil809]KRF33095.1 hypothetical protein ASG83_03665 [Yonghaparkia sp. Soil809]